MKGGGLFSPSCGPCNQGLVLIWGHTCGQAANGACLAPVHGCQKPRVHMAPLSGPVWCLAAMAAFAPFSPSHSLGGFGPLGHPKCGELQPCSTQQSRDLAQLTCAAPQIANQVPNASQQVGLHQFSPWWRNLSTWRKQGAHSYGLVTTEN